MKTLFMALVLMLTTIYAKSQNLINQSEDYIKQYFARNGIDYMGKKYANDGAAFLHFSYSTQSANQDGLISSYYFLDDNSICVSSIMLYEDQRYIEPIVSQFKADTDLVKVPNSFSWVSTHNDYYIFIEPKDNGSFTVTYKRTPPINK